MDAFFRDGSGDFKRRYQAISQDSRYGHYVRIPERICRCLDYFKISCDRRAVKEHLRAYYLFIGVVDDAIDSGDLETGQDILRQLEDPNPVFDAVPDGSRAGLVTEVLKAHIAPDSHSAIIAALDELYQAVVTERTAKTMSAYIEQRKAVGRLTAEISYLLIRSLFQQDHPDLRSFLQKVGEVGCLIDSAIDLRADARLGLIGFTPTLNAHLELMTELLRKGLGIGFKHIRLFRLFLEAVIDNLFDFRFRIARPPRGSLELTAGECSLSPR